LSVSKVSLTFVENILAQKKKKIVEWKKIDFIFLREFCLVSFMIDKGIVMIDITTGYACLMWLVLGCYFPLK
jgi:hypothetical protein